MSDGKMGGKLRVVSVQENSGGPNGTTGSEILKLHGVCTPECDETGLDEDKTFAKFSVSVDVFITVASPELCGQVKVGDELYVEFSPAT